MVHPALRNLIRNRIVAGLVRQGKSHTEAVAAVDSQLCDGCLGGFLADAGLDPPAGGILQWIITNLPAILELVTKLIALFAAL